MSWVSVIAVRVVYLHFPANSEAGEWSGVTARPGSTAGLDTGGQQQRVLHPASHHLAHNVRDSQLSTAQSGIFDINQTQS